MSIRRVAAALLAASLVAGCGLMAARQEQREARVVGDRLTAAGFRRVLYVGDEAAYQRYTNLELAKEEKTSAAAAKRDDRNAGVNDLPPELDAFEVDIEADIKR
jgi:hypothetical protein